ncbi:hypothetical protein N7462_003163 [Penicillium macrosclerotiorum]|uniref:uncharacterized protein n=1 Tax=Penicillium macrosclerotiorum TaxID=303699 RepID=UPI002547E203|nr:uncharacterized protein N7462_003163 [Penicillium macrosclerotiorum]KAJ5688771.1 hypothetical protein N7462_003163 [Penicillium macrosclerotiorum]
MGIFTHHDNDNDDITCPMPRPLVADAPENFVGDYTFHQFNMIFSGACTAITCLVIFALMFMHAIRYSNPNEQVKIMRIAMLFPLYSILSFFAICFPNSYVYLVGWIEVFQGLALYNFLMLLCDFLAPNDRHRVYFFANLRIPSKTGETTDGLSWLNKTWFLVIQYTPVAFVIAIAQCITEAANVYCLDSNDRHFAHLWLNILQVFSEIMAVMAILRFYMNLKSYMKEHKPLYKLLAFKLVVGLAFLEKIIFLILHSTDTLNPTSTLSYADAYIGIPTMIICLQMVPFSFFFHWAYSTRPYELTNNSGSREYLAVEETQSGRIYKTNRYQGGFLGLYAWFALFNPVELFREIKATYSMFQASRMAMDSQGNDRMQYEM